MAAVSRARAAILALDNAVVIAVVMVDEEGEQLHNCQRLSLREKRFKLQEVATYECNKERNNVNNPQRKARLEHRAHLVSVVAEVAPTGRNTSVHCNAV